MDRRAVIGLIALLVLLVPALLLLPRYRLDGAQGVLLSIMLPEDTEFAPGCSDLAFCSVRKGMTQQEVTERLGAPLVRWRRDRSSANVTWDFTRSPHSKNYRIRQIDLRNGIVVAVRSYFYVD